MNYEQIIAFDRELDFRRGFDHGYHQAVEDMKAGYTIDQCTKHSYVIEGWRWAHKRTAHSIYIYRDCGDLLKSIPPGISYTCKKS